MLKASHKVRDKTSVNISLLFKAKWKAEFTKLPERLKFAFFLAHLFWTETPRLFLNDLVLHAGTPLLRKLLCKCISKKVLINSCKETKRKLIDKHFAHIHTGTPLQKPRMCKHQLSLRS